MITSIANPIYNSVFKFLMDDEIASNIILSAILGKQVIRIEAFPHDYPELTCDITTMFQCDYIAIVRESDGKEHLILVELQKTWLETETFRFRQFLGSQYNDKRNIRKDNRDGYAIPMVTIYLLGHRVGGIEEPVVYVNHKLYDSNGNEVTEGMPDPFIESLVHNSIIVQIPLLHGQINNRLEKVLSVFDQTKADELDPHVLTLDGNTYEGDDNMEYIVHRLTEAAADADMRQDMNVEDEYYSALENRDTAIMNRDKKIREQNDKISEQSNTISEQSNTISEQSNTISEQSNTISEQSNTISEQSNTISEQSAKLTEQQEQIRSMAIALRDGGMPIEQISKLTGIDGETLKGILDSH